MIKDRLTSLDVFRGFTIMLMTIVNNPGSWSAIYPPLEHAEWNGCTPTDLVFPFFIFIMGTAIPFAMPSKTFNGTVFNKIVVRSLRIICLGLFLNYFGKIEFFDWEGIPLLTIRLLLAFAVAYALLGNFSAKIKTYLAVAIFLLFLFLAFSGIESYQEVRIPGVLQRIGIVYFFSSILYLKASLRNQILVAAILLLGYWGLMTLITIPEIGASNLEKGTNFAAYIDSVILKNHMWVQTKTWDPEGLLGTIPAIASGIMGMLMGQLLHLSLPKIEIVKKMVGFGFGLVLLGLIWNITFPINKSLWSSSYVIYTAGLASLCLSLLYYIIEIKNYKKWTTLFLIWGVNPMIVFFFSGIIPRALSMITVKNNEIIPEPISLSAYFYKYGITPLFENPLNASLSYALFYAIFWSFVLWVFYRNKMFFKV